MIREGKDRWEQSGPMNEGEVRLYLDEAFDCWTATIVGSEIGDLKQLLLNYVWMSMESQQV